METRKISDYMEIGEASEFMGVSKGTLRRWDNDGKVKCYRNPISKYRLYLKEDLEKLLEFEKE